ncbi:MAG: hypothetical protein KME10_20420 [Plectolyngbya sp. WJT66-NPBG17]|jgi:hypothetical protein|nr:hypothetical protein [Plectolyngbya sp. WJT66-NPBG17]
MEQQNNSYGRDQNVINHNISISLSLQEDQFASTACVLGLEIQQDCNLLQELLEQKEGYLSDKWRSCLKQNRSVWQDIPSRSTLVKSNKTLMQYVQCFYQKLDSIEEHCGELLNLNAKILPLEAKPRYGGSGILGFGTTPIPAWAEQYYSESDAMTVINIGKCNSIKLGTLKETVREALQSGYEIISLLE